ncbi:helix-turn-helix transcriptional regulator [Rhizomonospora bruguierae]|uniref:helix-turn-helix transcriptional regulator n=1 Tax=Rhizomonospora bruguierae TaxID=1581705 RepID=UPI001BCE9FC0|nr:helix-turn-helix transcriptional regulator [Micromonospora sp. NBRC 107566]
MSTHNRLRELRGAAALSQQDVAERMTRLAAAQGRSGVAVSAHTVSRWERAKVVPGALNRRLLAEVLGVSVADLGLDPQPIASIPDFMEAYVGEDPASADPRVTRSQEEWQRARRALNVNRFALTQIAAQLYEPEVVLGGTGLIAPPSWMPTEPIPLDAIQLDHEQDAPTPTLDGTEAETAHVRPRKSLVQRYPRYSNAIRDLAHPRLFENRPCWRLTDVSWVQDKGRMAFADTAYFCAVDVAEVLAHELAYVALGEDGSLPDRRPVLRELPFRRLVHDPFDLSRRPVLPAISTLTIRRGADGDSFILHRRDPRSVAIAGGMLQVIPSGIFQPSSVLPSGVAVDFGLWRNIQREYSEELLGNAEHDGDGQPVRYDDEPFVTLDRARADGRLKVFCLGVALDALTLISEVLTVAVFDADLFDELAGDFVEFNDEGLVLTGRAPFTERGVRTLLDSGRASPGHMAPAGAGCLELAWQHRDVILA